MFGYCTANRVVIDTCVGCVAEKLEEHIISSSHIGCNHAAIRYAELLLKKDIYTLSSDVNEY